MVSVDVYRNQTTRHARVLLPTTFGLERDHYDLALNVVAVRNVARWSPALFRPPPGVREDFAVIADLACAIAAREKGAAGMATSAALRAMRAIGATRLLDAGLRAGPHRLSVRELATHPRGVDLGPLEPRLPNMLFTPGRKLRLAPERMVGDVARLKSALEADVTSEGNGQGNGHGGLVLIGRRLLRGNNSWMHNSHRLVKGRHACTLLMHPRDAGARGLETGARVRLRSRVGEVRVPVEVTDDIAPGVVSLPHGYGHDREGVVLSVARAHGGPSINDVTDESRVDPLSGTAAFNGTPVTVERE
jgi:anaerobic selenocysteine-containing dehydrogenase